MENYLYKLSLLVISVLVSANSAISQPFPPVKVENCPARSGAINIDGIDDETFWSEVQEFTIFSLSNEGDWGGPSDLSVEMKFAWDDTYFYIFVDIMDDIEHNWNGTEGNNYEFDNIDIFIQLDTATIPTSYNESTSELRINRGLEDAWISTAGNIRNNAVIVWHQENTLDGWVVEAAIPWLSCMPSGSLPEDVMDHIDGLIGFDMMIVDSDGDDPVDGDRGNGTQMMWDEDGDEGDTADGTEDLAWNNTSVFGYLELVGTPTPPPNKAPVADAGHDQAVNENTEVTLDGTGSYDPEGEAITYLWTAPEGIILSDAASPMPIFMAPNVQETSYFDFGLEVFDEELLEAYDEVRITVLDYNQSPIAEAGSNQAVDENTEVTLDGTASYDPDGESITYNWTVPAWIVLSDATSPSPTFTAPEVNMNTTVNIYLQVYDGEKYGNDYVTILINHINKPPVADAGPDLTVNEQELVLIQGSVSDPDMYDQPSMSWDTPQGIPFFHDYNGYPMLVAPNVLKDETFQFVLQGNDGLLEAEPDTMNLFVTAFGSGNDTLIIYDTVYVVETVYNTIMISVVDDQDNLIAREKDGELYVKLFPNPADQYVNIHSDMTISEIEIVDVPGNVVLHETVNALTAELNLGGFSAGNYFLRIHTESGLVIKQLVLE